MLLAIDVGNSHTVFGVHDGAQWHSWRMHTNAVRTEDEHAALLHTMLAKEELTEPITEVIVGSVVPPLEEIFQLLARKWFHVEPLFVTADLDLGYRVAYQPPSAVGADRLANATAAVEQYGVPVLIVDFGTAITLDTVSRDREYLGGSIMPGVYLALEALAGRTAKLPRIALHQPPEAIGRTTPDSLRSGVLLGSAGAIEYLIGKFKETLGMDTHVVATGGLSELIAPLCPSIQYTDVNLTLDGLKAIWKRNQPNG